MALFISNGAGVHSINEGDRIPAGWSEITAAEAEKVNPGLFGAPTDENGNVVVAKPALKAVSTK